jgi:aspartyl-tRNA(Asn)/glutamyl-tRNA(Gln) amidotransferase subunit B
MRSKEEAHDYRYFPEPDLVPMVISKEEVEKLKTNLPELPQVRMKRFMQDYGLPEYDASVLTAKRTIADFFERCAGVSKNSKAIGNWIMGDLMRELKQQGLEIQQSPVTPENLVGLIELIDEGVISGKMAKDVFGEIYKTGKSPKEIVKSKGLTQLSDKTQIEEAIRKVLQENQKTVQDFFDGKKNALAFLVGQTMKLTQGRANPKMVNELLVQEIERLK